MIRVLASDLVLGEQSQNIVCPFCKGGHTKEKSFSIKREPTGLLYHCYRATCGSRGFVPCVGGVFGGKAKERPPNPYTRPLRRLHARERRFFMRKYQLRSSSIRDFCYATVDQRVAMPIIDVRGFRIGWNLRHYPELALEAKETSRKAITYWDNTNVPTLHFEAPRSLHTSLVLVEDQLSAKRVSIYQNAVALMGCNLTDQNVQHLLDLGVQDVYIALDGDAWEMAQKIKEKYLLFFRNFNVITWSDKNTDPKDMTEEALKQIFGELQ